MFIESTCDEPRHANNFVKNGFTVFGTSHKSLTRYHVLSFVSTRPYTRLRARQTILQLPTSDTNAMHGPQTRHVTQLHITHIMPIEGDKHTLLFRIYGQRCVGVVRGGFREKGVYSFNNMQCLGVSIIWESLYLLP